MRASDSERDAVVGRLAAHHAAGRLAREELEDRTAFALAARTLDELAALESDLPAPTQRSSRRLALPSLGRFRVYLPVMALLIAIWAVTGAGYFWPMWPALGWGLALAGPGPCLRHRHGAPFARRT